MSMTGYVVLKDHFDKLLTGGYPNNGLEQIRDVYKYAFNKPIHRYEVYQSSLRIGNNPINKIITLVGPDSSNIPCGIIPCNNDITCVNVMDNDYLKGIDESNIGNYIKDVYMAMSQVTWADKFGNVSDIIARSNPYCAFIKVCAFYFTFHHIKACVPDMIDCEVFSDILEKYICSGDDISMVLNSLKNNKYDATFESVYSTMTCNNTVELFL